MASAEGPDGGDPAARRSRLPDRRGAFSALVSLGALVAVVLIVVIVVTALPAAQKGQNVIAIATAGFGVIGAIVGAYFGVSSANRAAELVQETGASQSGQRGFASGGS